MRKNDKFSWTDIREKKLKKLLDDGISITNIGKYFNVGYWVIQSKIKRMGLIKRKRA